MKQFFYSTFYAQELKQEASVLTVQVNDAQARLKETLAKLSSAEKERETALGQQTEMAEQLKALQSTAQADSSSVDQLTQRISQLTVSLTTN